IAEIALGTDDRQNIGLGHLVWMPIDVKDAFYTLALTELEPVLHPLKAHEHIARHQRAALDDIRPVSMVFFDRDLPRDMNPKATTAHFPCRLPLAVRVALNDVPMVCHVSGSLAIAAANMFCSVYAVFPAEGFEG